MDFNYHFDGLLSLLLALVCLNGYLRIGSFRWRMVYGAVAAWVGYLLAGPHLLLAVIAAVLWEVCCGKSRWKGGSLLLLPWGFGLPLLLYGLGWGGEWRLLATPDAYYHPLLLSQKVNYLPGILVLLNVLAACILHRSRKSLSGWRLWASWGIQICLLAGIFHQGIRHYSNDRNYETMTGTMKSRCWIITAVPDSGSRCSIIRACVPDRMPCMPVIRIWLFLILVSWEMNYSTIRSVEDGEQSFPGIKRLMLPCC